MFRLFVSAAFVIIVVGCQTKLSDTRTIDVEPGGDHSVYVDGPRYDQKVNIEFTSSAGPVFVFVCLKKDEQTIMAAGPDRENHASVLGSKLNAINGVIDVAIPAKQEFAILISGAGKRTTVTLKIKGR